MIIRQFNTYKNKLNNNLHLKEILLGSANTLVLKVSGMILGLGVAFIISKQYGAEGIGLYYLSIRTLTILGLLSMVGINTSILRYVGEFNNKENIHKLKLLFKNSIQITLPISILIGLLLFITSDFIANNLFNNIKYKNPLRLLSLLLPFWTILDISIQFIRGLKYIRISESLRSITQPIINIVLIIVLGIFIQSYLLPIFTFSFAVIISTVISIYFIYKKIKHLQIRSDLDFKKNELLKTSMPMMVIALVIFLQSNISLFFLEVYTSTDQVGIFSISLKLATLIGLVLIAVNTISAPKFSELYWSNQHEELQKVIFHSSKLIFVFSLMLAVILVSLSESILQVFGNDFSQGKIAIYILIFGYVIGSISGSVGLLLNMTGHQIFLRNILLIILPLNILLNIVLVPLYGINGAAIVNMVSISLANIIPVIYSIKKLNLVTFYIPYISKNIIEHYSNQNIIR